MKKKNSYSYYKNYKKFSYKNIRSASGRRPYISAAQRKKRKKRRIAAGIAVCAVLLILFLLYGFAAMIRTGTLYPTAELLDGRATFRFLDVGQGDCTLVTWQGEAILIDAGPASVGKSTAQTVSLYAPEVDYFIITHPHEDHMGGAAAVLDAVSVKNLVLPAASSEEKFYRNAVEAAEKHRVNVITVTDGAAWETEHLSVTVFDPLDLPLDDLNDASLITRIDAGGVSLLAAGDAELPAETHALSLNDPLLDCDILKVGHHGSDSSTSIEFLEAVSPEIGVISAGRGNSYGHPHRKTVTRLTNYGCTVRRTDREGMIVLRGADRS